jgi:hypothetical protein
MSNKLNDALKTRYATQEDLKILQKAMDTTTGADKLITVAYDKELQKDVYMQSPFLRYCEANGVVTGANSDKVGYRKKTKNTKSSFIDETEAIPEFTASSFDDAVAKMRTLVYPVEVSDLAQKGVDAVDLLNDEIQDGYLDIAQTKDKAILQGVGGDSDKDFPGLITSTKTHATSNTNKVLDLDTVDNVAQEIIDDGGSPSAIVTTAKVQSQLKNMMESKQRFLDKVDLNIGVRVTGYNAPNGVTIPIIVDPNIDTTKTEGHVLQFIDNRSYKVRELQAPTLVDLAKTKLSTSKLLFTWVTAYNRAEQWNGKITNIGDTE